jgi:hypothetical protein
VSGRRARRNRLWRHELETRARAADKHQAQYREADDKLRNERDAALGKIARDYTKKLADLNADLAKQRREVWRRYDEERAALRSARAEQLRQRAQAAS